MQKWKEYKRRILKCCDATNKCTHTRHNSRIFHRWRRGAISRIGWVNTIISRQDWNQHLISSFSSSCQSIENEQTDIEWLFEEFLVFLDRCYSHFNRSVSKEANEVCLVFSSCQMPSGIRVLSSIEKMDSNASLVEQRRLLQERNKSALSLAHSHKRSIEVFVRWSSGVFENIFWQASSSAALSEREERAAQQETL